MASPDCQGRRHAAFTPVACRGAAGDAPACRQKLEHEPQNMSCGKPTMRRSQRLIAATVLVALSSALGGCSSGLSNWDPTDLLDFLDTKKKLPGERKAVFPDGVPGLEQGVPKELYKGSAQERIDQQNAEAATAAASTPRPAEPNSKQAAKSKGRGKQPAAASAAPAQDPASTAATAAPEP